MTGDLKRLVIEARAWRYAFPYAGFCASECAPRADMHARMRGRKHVRTRARPSICISERARGRRYAYPNARAAVGVRACAHIRTRFVLFVGTVPTALAACCGFDLCHKYILYLYLYFTQASGGSPAVSEHSRGTVYSVVRVHCAATG